jgi:hypothetical protein
VTGRRRRRDPGRVIIAPAASEQQARVLADAYRYVLRDLLIADRSRVDMGPGDGEYLAYGYRSELAGGVAASGTSGTIMPSPIWPPIGSACAW